MRAGYGLPSGSKPLTRRMTSRPVQAPSGRCEGASGERGRGRYLPVVGLYAVPRAEASPQQPPPQPMASRPVQRTIPSGTERGSLRQTFREGSYATFAPKTSTSRPVQTASQQPSTPPRSAGGDNVRQRFFAGSNAVAAFFDGLSATFVSGVRPTTMSCLSVQTLAPYGRATGSRGSVRQRPGTVLEPDAAAVAVTATRAAAAAILMGVNMASSVSDCSLARVSIPAQRRSMDVR